MPTASTPVRALTARSAILSVLLGAHPAEAPVGWIVRVGTGLGLQESAVRAALTRMVAAGDLERSDATYRLSERLAERQRRQDAAVSPDPRPWDGRWVLGVVTVGAADSTDRAAFRDALRQARLGELREGVWCRPDNIGLTMPAAARERLVIFHGDPEEPSPELARRLFHPERWAARAGELLAAFAAADTITARFEVAAATVRHILDDPVLPVELLPADWPGAAIRARYAEFRAEFYAFAADHIGENPQQTA
ncbi:PaaX family transcriptional regulator C-terminal domain-containing protein [Nocardia cyriacigeorgica]|uniref:PaaX family transcriptional regulator C-terminal domain-containing protein n=1 Tax=Nocardia cyriacigeorgica TaxID=135487 RepID=UPI0013D786E7|nr:PaaX family transcriptional regulator C-terminal domain-containing protein [Nocardia cyriacigeorgica]NEW27204.1 PaaX domain-containing protein, C- domain protein [Nocardia cyriacigeorgica]